VQSDSNPGWQPFGFAGGLQDQDTGLVRFGARDYDPEEGRWSTADRLGNAGGLNRFIYTSDNPLNLVDPTGLAPCGPSPAISAQADALTFSNLYHNALASALASRKWATDTVDWGLNRVNRGLNAFNQQASRAARAAGSRLGAAGTILRGLLAVNAVASMNNPTLTAVTDEVGDAVVDIAAGVAIGAVAVTSAPAAVVLGIAYVGIDAYNGGNSVRGLRRQAERLFYGG